MPPKSKTGGKNLPVNRNKPGPSKDVSTKTETASGLSQEAEDQFELELCWCIQQLEVSLASGKLQEKQGLDLNKNLNILKSNTAPLIKKRQVMRNTLGNYREKMTQDEQKHSKTTASAKFIKPVNANKKFIFLRKHENKSINDPSDCNTVSPKNLTNKNDSDNVQNSFKFNFQIAQ